MPTGDKTHQEAVARPRGQAQDLAAYHAGKTHFVAELAQFLKHRENVAEAVRQALQSMPSAGVAERVDPEESCPEDDASRLGLPGEDDLASENGDRSEPSELDRLVEWALELRARQRAPIASTVESELLKQINQGLPEFLEQRLAVLVAKQRAETLTEDEEAELIRLGDEAERLEASRVQALAELAAARHTTLPRLMQEIRFTAGSCPRS